MRKCKRTPTNSSIDEFARLGFDVAKEIGAHLADVEERITAEEQKNKTSKVIHESLLKEREQMLSALLPYEFTPLKTEVIEEEAEAAT